MIFEGQSLSTSEHNDSLPQYPIENKAKIIVVPKQAIKDITEWKVFPEDENMAQRIAGLQSKQPLYVRIVLSNVFHIGIAVAIVLNCVYVLIDASIRSDENATHAVWLVFELVFCVIFLVEAVLKITAMRVEYFRDGYNNFDFFLVILGIVGAALSILTVVSAHPEQTQAEDSVGGASSEARIMRVARVFRILRFLRIFRLFHAKLSMDAEVSVDLSNHMKRISTMTVFVRGHLAAQVQLVKYFGGNGVVDKPDEAELGRCVLQSQLSNAKAERATYIAVTLFYLTAAIGGGSSPPTPRPLSSFSS